MTIIEPEPYPAELLRIARKVVWFDAPEETLRGAPTEVTTVKRYIPEDEFRKVLEDAPPGVFTTEAWQRWHERLGLAPVPPLPRRRFPGGTPGTGCLLWTVGEIVR